MSDLPPLECRGTRPLQLSVVSRDDSSQLRIDLVDGRSVWFLSIRRWIPGRHDSDVWLPDAEQGVSIKMRELHAVADAVNRAMAPLEVHEADGGER
jgi:hypothetical protein